MHLNTTVKNLKNLKFLSVWGLMPKFIYKTWHYPKMMSSCGSNRLMLHFCTHSINTSVPTKSKTLVALQLGVDQVEIALLFKHKIFVVRGLIISQNKLTPT